MLDPTPMRKQILTYIQDYTSSHEFSPSIREIMNAVGLKTPSTVHYHLRAMEDIGLITRKEGAPRTIVINKQPAKTKNIDVLLQKVTEAKHSDEKAKELAAWLTTHGMCNWYTFLNSPATV